MNRLLAILCLSLPLCAEDDHPPIEEIDSEEIAFLEPTFLDAPLISQEEIDLSELEPVRGYKSPFWAVALSSIVPGLGQAYLGNYGEATALFGSSTILTGVGMNEKIDDSVRTPSLITGQNLWFYGIYAAYRDVRTYNCDAGYCYKMPTENLTQLISAPFKWSILKKPEVWGGCLGALTLACGVSYFFDKESECKSGSSSDDEMFPLLAFPVGIGEEAFFRGYLQSALSESLSPWGAIIASSLLFGAVHIPNAQALERDERKSYYRVSLPFITSLGIYFGWLTYKNKSLNESVAVHSWYDFALFALSYSVAQSAATRKPSVAFAFSF